MGSKTVRPIRKIHIDLPESLHMKLRIKAALEDVSMQALVAQILGRALTDVQLPKKDRKKHEL